MLVHLSQQQQPQQQLPAQLPPSLAGSFMPQALNGGAGSVWSTWPVHPAPAPPHPPPVVTSSNGVGPLHAMLSHGGTTTAAAAARALPRAAAATAPQPAGDAMELLLHPPPGESQPPGPHQQQPNQPQPPSLPDDQQQLQQQQQQQQQQATSWEQAPQHASLGDLSELAPTAHQPPTAGQPTGGAITVDAAGWGLLAPSLHSSVFGMLPLPTAADADQPPANRLDAGGHHSSSAVWVPEPSVLLLPTNETHELAQRLATGHTMLQCLYESADHTVQHRRLARLGTTAAGSVMGFAGGAVGGGGGARSFFGRPGGPALGSAGGGGMGTSVAWPAGGGGSRLGVGAGEGGGLQRHAGMLHHQGPLAGGGAHGGGGGAHDRHDHQFGDSWL